MTKEKAEDFATCVNALMSAFNIEIDIRETELLPGTMSHELFFVDHDPDDPVRGRFWHMAPWKENEDGSWEVAWGSDERPIKGE